MKNEAKQKKRTRTRYPEEYKKEALKLVERVGVPTAAKQLGVSEALLYSWRSKTRLHEEKGEAEARLLAENARLKRQLAEKAEELEILKKAAAYFAKSLR